MAWSAAIIFRERYREQIRFVVTYSNGTDSFDDNIFLSPSNVDAQIAQVINAKIDALEQADITEVTTDVGPIALAIKIAPGPTLIVPPSIEQQFSDDLNLWQAYQQAISFGAYTGNEQEILDLKKRLVTNFQPSFLGL